MPRTERANIPNVTVDMRTTWLESDMDQMEAVHAQDLAAIRTQLDQSASRLRSQTTAIYTLAISVIVALVTLLGTVIAVRP